MKDFYCVKNDTWCIDTGRTLIGVYRLNDNDVILLDSGTSYGGAETKKLMAVVEGAGLRVKAVIATHGHLDHIGNNENLIKMFDTKVYMYGAEAYMCSDMDSLRMQHSLVPFDETIEKALRCMKSRVDVFIDPHVRSVDICGRKFGIIHTPGHSMSHISIITPDNIGMLGDALMTENEIVKTKIPYASNFAVDFASKRKLPELNCDRYIISHRGVRSGWELEREVEGHDNALCAVSGGKRQGGDLLRKGLYQIPCHRPFGRKLSGADADKKQSPDGDKRNKLKKKKTEKAKKQKTKKRNSVNTGNVPVPGKDESP